MNTRDKVHAHMRATKQQHAKGLAKAARERRKNKPKLTPVELLGEYSHALKEACLSEGLKPRLWARVDRLEQGLINILSEANNANNV